jgi:hypothetical protein
MGEAKRKKLTQEQAVWPHAGNFQGMIDLHMLPPVPATNGARIHELTGDNTIPDTTQIILHAFRADAVSRSFHAGFCLGNESGFSVIRLLQDPKAAVPRMVAF